MSAYDLVCARLAACTDGTGKGGSWPCPAHEDDRPSLSVGHGQKGAVVHCHAGCELDDVLAALDLERSDLFDQPRDNGAGDKREIVATYQYVDEAGNLLYETVRYRPKDFRQRQPDGKGDWVWNLKGVRRVLYRLPEVLAAKAERRTIWVVEGEKDADAIARAGEVATTCPMGAGKWRGEYTDTLAGANVSIVADADVAGTKHARRVAQDLEDAGCKVRTFIPRTGKDVADHLGAGHGLGDLVAPDDQPPEPPPDEDKAEKKSASTILVEIAEQHYDFGVSATGETFAVPKSGPKVVLMLRGGKKSLRAQLAREYFQQYRKAAPQQALADALLVVEGTAQDSDEQTLHLRVAHHEGAIWLDLGDQTGRAVKITPDGWTVEAQAPVLFKRTPLNAPLPEPVRGGELSELWDWLNVDPDDEPLVTAWQVASFLEDIPHPVLGLFGEQGTGKTTAAKVLVSTVDPSPVPARKPPKDAESWVTAAAGSWVVGLDNLSDIPPWLSDAMCRAVTGDGDVRRRLYTDGDLAVFAFRRCLILNGIDLGALRGDLAERMLPITLRRIPDAERIDEEELWPRWGEAHPRILGALLDLVAGVAGVLPSVRLETKPRMADFAKVLAAIDQVLDAKGLTRYLAKQGALATDSLEGDEFITAIRDKVTESFTGTSSELLRLVTPTDDGWRAPKGWPRNARSVTSKLHRWAPVMRKAGWVVDNDEGDNHDKVMRWAITPPTREVGNPDPRHPRDPRQGSHAADSSQQDGEADTREPRASRGTEPPTDPRHPHDRGSDPRGTAERTTPLTSVNPRTAGVAGVAGHESVPLSYEDTDDYEARYPEIFAPESESA